MSCFWDTLLRNIKKEDITNVLGISSHTPLDFCSALQTNNCKTGNVLWNGSKLTGKQYDENIEWINEYKPDTIQNGYDCSVFDPFLLLITELFRIEIMHVYNGIMIDYKHREETKYKIKLQSNKNHMW